MMRSIFAALAAVLGLAACPTSATAQCKCGKPAASATAANSDGEKATQPKKGCAHCAGAGSGHECCGNCGSKSDTPAAANADDKPVAKPAKEVTISGTMHCAKCGLKMDGIRKCTNAIVVKEKDKEVTYLLDDKGAKESYHGDLCGGGKTENVKVTGTVAEKDGKKWIKATKVEAKK